MCSRLLKKVTANYDLCCVVVGLDLVGPFYLSAGCSLRNSSQKHASFCQSYSITVTIVKIIFILSFTLELQAQIYRLIVCFCISRL